MITPKLGGKRKRIDTLEDLEEEIRTSDDKLHFKIKINTGLRIQ
jgi:hypothetical protein